MLLPLSVQHVRESIILGSLQENCKYLKLPQGQSDITPLVLVPHNNELSFVICFENLCGLREARQHYTTIPTSFVVMLHGQAE